MRVDFDFFFWKKCKTGQRTWPATKVAFAITYGIISFEGVDGLPGVTSKIKDFFFSSERQKIELGQSLFAHF